MHSSLKYDFQAQKKLKSTQNAENYIRQRQNRQVNNILICKYWYFSFALSVEFLSNYNDNCVFNRIARDQQ